MDFSNCRKLVKLWLRVRATGKPRESQVWSVLIRNLPAWGPERSRSLCSYSGPWSWQRGFHVDLGSVFELENRVVGRAFLRAHLEFLTLCCSLLKFLPTGT